MRILQGAGAAFAAAGICALSACGGGGSHASGPLPGATPTAAAGNPAVSGTSRVTVTIHRRSSSTASAMRASKFVPPPAPARVAASPRLTANRNAELARVAANAARAQVRAAAGTRAPKYFSPSAAGLVITVAAAGTTLSQTIYADISATSPLCTTVSMTSTCTLTIPNLATSESITAVETDAGPSGTTGTPGYGTAAGYGVVLGAANVSATITSSAGTPIAMTMSPVASLILDADGDVSQPSDAQGRYLASNPGGGHTHVYLQNGTPISGFGVLALVWDGDRNDVTTTFGTPFVDVNGTATPVTFTSNFAGVTLYAEPDGNMQNATPAYAATTSLSDAGAQDYNQSGDISAVVRMAYDGTPLTAATMAASNNLSAPLPSYAYYPVPTTTTWNVTGVGTDVPSATVGVGATTVINGVDADSADGMDVADNNYTQNTDCLDASYNLIANVSQGAYNATTGYQPFTVTGVNAGQCTLYFFDADTDVSAQPVTVTVQ